MNLALLVRRSLLHNWRTGLAVVFGLTVAVAVVTGSLVIGDSVRGSIRDTALSRLGQINEALTAPTFFRTRLASDLARTRASTVLSRTAALIVLRGTAENANTAAVAPQTTVIGVAPNFWGFWSMTRPVSLTDRQVAINQALAGDLGLKPGDWLILTVPRPSPLGTDTLFSHRKLRYTAPSLRVQVAAIVPQPAGNFRLNPQSAVPRNLFVSRAWLARELDLVGQANTIVATTRGGATGDVGAALAAGLQQTATLGDRGLSLTIRPHQHCLSLTSAGLLLRQSQVAVAQRVAQENGAQAQPASAYLATVIKGSDGRQIAYSVVAALPPPEPFVFQAGGQPAPGKGEIWLNTWAAADLKAHLGETLDLTYLAPTRDGSFPKRHARFRLSGIVAMQGPAADRALFPQIKGITDAATVASWQAPFPLDLSLITPRDEQYWDRYRATPKAFLNLDALQAMWSSAPGQANGNWVTSLRLRPLQPGDNLTTFRARVGTALLQALSPAQAGLVFLPVQQEALAASQGTSDFSQLFLGLSMFLVFAGVGLAAVLLRLAVDRRSAEAGLMLAGGFRTRTVGRLFLAEGLVLAVIGALLGVPVGVAYGAVIIATLTHSWHGALGSTSSLWLHVTPASLVIGGLVGLIVGAGTVWWATRRLTRQRVLALLAGPRGMEVVARAPSRRRGLIVLIVSLVAAVGLLLTGLSGGMSPTAAFFSVGALLLVAALAGAGLSLSASLRRARAYASTGRLAWRSAAAARGRALLVVGTLACAAFIIVTVAANTRSFAGPEAGRKSSGTGGFALQATATIPLPYDPATAAGRRHLGFLPADEAALQGVQIISFLASPGDDISCLNLARPRQPRLLGVPAAMVRRGGFSPQLLHSHGGSATWAVLEQSLPHAIPAFGDADSVMWTLHSGLGKIYDVPGVDGKKVPLRFVGVLPGSIFARELLISEDQFRRLYPTITGPSYFLISAPPQRAQQVATILRRRLGGLGVQVRATPEVLNQFMAVQNTYLQMFLALGGLGLILGTVGLAIVLWRNALERRREFALMSAVGFRRRQLLNLLLVENSSLLAAGLLAGTVAALVAVAPQIVSSNSHVNWAVMLTVLGAILVTGLVTCALAVRSVVRERLAPALREE